MRNFLCAILFLLVSLNHAFAQDDYYIEDFFVDLQLNKDGSIKITELIQVYFNTSRHGIYRDIPLEAKVKPEDSGEPLDKYFGHKLFIEDVDVKDHKFNKQFQGYGIRLKIGDPDVYVNGPVTYQISYVIKNGILHNKKHTELYWNLIGDYINEEVKRAGFKISIPKDIKINPEDIDVWTGLYGERSKNVTTSFENNVLTGESTEPLGRNKAMTVAIRMPPGSVPQYSSLFIWFYHFKYLMIPLAMLIGFIWVWRKHGNDTDLADMVAYLPPKGMDPAMAGFAIDIKANKRDALALIPYFGVNKYLELDHKENKGIFAEDEITFTKLKDLPENAPPHQKIFFNGLFEDGNVVKLSSLKDSFYTTLNQTLSAISDSVMNSDYFTRVSVKLYWNSIWIVILLGIINGVYCFFSGRILFMIITIVVSVLLAIYAFILLKRSQSGDELFKEIKGFRKFIRTAEKDKLEFLVKEDPSYFDKTLAYAIAFNCADEWGKKFKGLSLQPPQWYHSNAAFYSPMTGFNVSHFNQVMNSSLDDMRSVMSSSPSSSSSGSSGGGGGGFSGGGFGGGGTSSW